MTTRAEVVEEALSWIGTPYHHQARLKGVGVDCIGIITCIGKKFGFSNFDVTNYPRHPDPQMVEGLLRQHADPITKEQLLPGDFMWFRIDVPRHFGIVTEIDPIYFVHAFNRDESRRAKPSSNAVVRTRFEDVRGFRLVSCWRYRGIE